MIKRIITLKDFGVFKNFSWTSNPNLQEFTEKNILYGWNYSGKTTLSRLFSFIKEKSIPVEFQNMKFKIKLKNGIEYTQDDISSIPLNIQIFNSDYIKDNLHWDTDKHINGISFAIGEVANIKLEIDQNENKILSIEGNDKTKGLKEKFLPMIQTFNQFEDSKFTEISRNIQNNVFNSLIKFNKGDLKKTTAFTSSKITDFKVSDKVELKRLSSIAIAKNDKKEILNFEFELHLKEIYHAVSNLLISNPTKTDIIDVLLSNKEQYDWAQEGLRIHKGNNFDKCLFCGNDIKLIRIENLNRYFSSAEAILRNKIIEYKSKINDEITLIEQINIPKSANDFSDGYKEEYQKKLDEFDNIKQNYINSLLYLKELLQKKENGNLFNSIKTKPFDELSVINLNNWLKETQEYIDLNNKFIVGFEKNQEFARKAIINHHVAEFLIVEKYKQKEKASTDAKIKLEQCDRIVKYYKEKNIKLASRLKSVDLGREQLEDFIKKFLNREDLKIGLTEDDKFYLMRGEKIAKNLSEGEKTAISFSHFLVSLESLHKDDKLKDTVIFIDDPISSLDSNHTAQISSLINTFFFRKGLNPDNLDKVVNCFAQLFVSTHNFDFYSFLRDSKQMNKKKKDDQETMLSSFLIRKIDKENSEISCLPKSLKSFKSEYVYLFSIINDFHKSGCHEDNENLILMPNAIRRFLEIYTLIKIPGSTDEVDQRVKELIGEPNNLKVLHHFSHFTSFEKISKHDELIMKLPDLTNDLMMLLEQDPTHLTSLRSAI